MNDALYIFFVFMIGRFKQWFLAYHINISRSCSLPSRIEHIMLQNEENVKEYWYLQHSSTKPNSQSLMILSIELLTLGKKRNLIRKKLFFIGFMWRYPSIPSSNQEGLAPFPALICYFLRPIDSARSLRKEGRHLKFVV